MDLTSPIPLYYQLKQDILQKIESGVWKPGDQLPTEKWFCETYQISRATIRKTLDELIFEGVITRTRGKSAAVARQKVNRQISSLTGLHEELSQRGLAMSSSILWGKKVPAEKDLAQKLSVPEGEPLWAGRRVRMADGVPIADQTTFLVQRFVPGLDAKVLESKSLYSILENEYHLSLSYGRQTIGASVASREQARLLKIPADIPLLTVERTTYLQDDTPLEYTLNYYVSTLYSITTVLYR